MPEDKQIEFLESYNKSRESLIRFAKAMTRNREDALDLVQETTLKAFDNFEKLKNKQAFTSYLFTIATRIHKRNIWRKRLFFSFSKNDDYEGFFEDKPDPNISTDKRHDIEALYKALNKLPKEQKEAVALFEISGLSLEEIKEIQGVSLSGVKSRVQRGRKTLAKLLGAIDDTSMIEENKSCGGNQAQDIDSNKFSYLHSSLFSTFVKQEVL